MKKETDIMNERKDWIERISKEIKKRTFEMIEKKVEQNQWEYWENQFIPIQQSFIEDIFEEVFAENDQKDLTEKFPNISDEIYSIVFQGLKEELAGYGFKLGYTKRKDSFGIGALDSGLIEVGEKNGLTQKIKRFFAKPEMTVSTETSEEPQQIEVLEEEKEEE